MRKLDSRLLAGLILITGACAGCEGGVKREPVKGKVTLEGRPLAEVHVIFYPADAGTTQTTRYTGLTDDKGQFVMRDADRSEGVPAGKYRVTLTTAVAKPTDTETTPLPPERVPAEHRNQQFEVPAGGTSEANFELKSR
jgi:hypothetical protein